MLNFTESRDILKKENENFFDIDFKQEKVKSSDKKQDTDFFDFSMKPDKKATEDITPAIDTTEISAETQTEFAEELTEEIAEEATAPEVQEEPDDSNNESNEEEDDDDDDDDVIIETFEHSPAVDEPTEIQNESHEEVQPENPAVNLDKSPAPEVQEKVSAETPEEDDVIINVVSWGKVAPESQVKTVEPKKSNLVIDLEDGFEIKMCNFRGLSQKENNSDKNIKKN